jgi:hypothetical protein
VCGVWCVCARAHSSHALHSCARDVAARTACASIVNQEGQCNSGTCAHESMQCIETCRIARDCDVGSSAACAPVGPGAMRGSDFPHGGVAVDIVEVCLCDDDVVTCAIHVTAVLA